MHAEFWYADVKECGSFTDKGDGGNIILKRMLKKSNGERKLNSSA
jgi:hypothetical protein